MLEGGFLPERYEREAEEGKKRHEGLGDAASRYAEHPRDRTGRPLRVRNNRP